MQHGVTLESKDGKVRLTIPLRELVGAVQKPDSGDLTIVRMTLRDKKASVTFHKVELESAALAALWCAAIRSLATSCAIFDAQANEADTRVPLGEGDVAASFPACARRILVIVNPYSGRKKGPSTCKRFIAPLLDAAGVDHTIMETTHAGHAAEIGAGDIVLQYTCVMVVSGDGLLHEVIQGLMKNEALDDDSRPAVAVAPCGTGNGQATSLGLHTVEYTALAVIKGGTRASDLMRVRQGDETVWTALFTHWGVVSDVDFKSENLRWMGPVRFTLASVQRLILRRLYHGRFAYLPAPNSDELVAAGNAGFCDKTARTCERCDEGGGADGVASASPPRTKKKSGGKSKKKKKTATTTTTASTTTATTTNEDGGTRASADAEHENADLANFSFDDPPPGWVVLDDNFFFLHCGKTSYISWDVSFTPLAHMSDGLMDVLVCRAPTRMTLVKLFVDVANPESVLKAVQANAEHLQYVKVHAAVFEPLDNCYLNVDGEQAKQERATVDVKRRALKMTVLFADDDASTSSEAAKSTSKL